MNSQRTPLFFIGHGSPMNAIADNAYTQTLAKLRSLCPNPRAILCISAHWMTDGTWVTHMTNPRTIHDFGGFPKELFDVQYPAPGSPEVAELVSKSLSPNAGLDDQDWGLDHGTWSVLRHIFPKADIPVVQLSLDLSQPPEYHAMIGTQLRSLRQENILILGSGNLVHNLRQIRWAENAPPFPWAIEFDEWLKERLQKKDFAPLMHGYLEMDSGKLSVPTPEHYLPLLYILGASDPADQLHFEYEEIQNGSISMRSFSLR